MIYRIGFFTDRQWTNVYVNSEEVPNLDQIAEALVYYQTVTLRLCTMESEEKGYTSSLMMLVRSGSMTRTGQLFNLLSKVDATNLKSELKEGQKQQTGYLQGNDFIEIEALPVYNLE
jgi:hypothetical protein